MSATPNAVEFSAESFDGSIVPEAIELDESRRALWDFKRLHWAPRTTVLRDGSGVVVAAALTASRPYLLSRKIVDAAVVDSLDGPTSTAAFRALIAAATADAPLITETRPAPVLVRFEEHPHVAPLGEGERRVLSDLGFEQDPVPLPSVPSTREQDPAGVRSWSRWHPDAKPARLVSYYGQTTDVTCGAITALMALESAGLGKFSATDGDKNHTWEIDFWRRATNLPACEPIGLAVATAGAITDAGLPLGLPRVVLSAEGPILVEDFGEEWDRKFRSELQAESLVQAERLGLPIERRWPDVTEIHQLVAAGNSVFLLIDLESLIGDPTPHWVLAHDVVGEDALIVSDPWVESTEGETWLDTNQQPISLAGIDKITRWGTPAYRGIIVLPQA